LEMNDYNLSKAITEFEADLEFEKQVVKQNREFKKQAKKRQKIGIFG